MSKGIKEYPSNPTHVQGVKNNINELVDAMLRIESEKELQKTIYETALEKYGVDKTWLKEQATLRYDTLYNESKKANAIKEKAEQLEIFETMFN